MDGVRRLATYRNLNLARQHLRPISLAHPEMPDCSLERSTFIGRENGANPPGRQRSDKSDRPVQLLGSLAMRRAI
jgi:hypothetical protein